MSRFFTFALLACAVAASPARADFVITDLGTFGGSVSWGFDVNASGQVTGFANNAAGDSRAFLYSGGPLQDLGTLKLGTVAVGLEINASGQVAGLSTLSGPNVRHAFLYSGGAMLDLQTLGGAESVAHGLNASAQVVGWSNTTGGQTHAFLYSGGPLVDLGTLGGTFSDAYSINAGGQVIGRSTIAGDLATHAFLHSGGGMQDLGTLGGTHSEGAGITDAGVVAGNSYTTGDGEYHAFIYSAGVMTDLGTLGGTISEANGINNSDVVAGSSTLANGDRRAVMWVNGTIIDLNDLIPGNPNWLLTNAWQVSDTGYITGYGFFNGEQRAFLLTPVPEPGTWALLGACAAAALAWKRRRR